MKALELLSLMPMKRWVRLGMMVTKSHTAPYQTRKMLAELLEQGLVERRGKTKSTEYRRVEKDTVEIAAFPLPKEVGDYFTMGTEFMSLAGHYDEDQSRKVSANVHRNVTRFLALGLIERKKAELGVKRGFLYRRKYHSITFRDDGVVVFE